MTKGITGFNIQRRRGTGSEQLSAEERQAKAELEAYLEDCATFVEARNKVLSMSKNKEEETAKAERNLEEEDQDEEGTAEGEHSRETQRENREYTQSEAKRRTKQRKR